MTMSDRVVVMREGEIVQVGDPIELYRSPRTLFVAAFVGSPNVWAGTVTALEGGRVVVAVGERRFEAPPPPLPVRPGERVALVLRAEVLTLASGRQADAGSGLSAVVGTVADVRFVGAVVTYRIDLGDRHLTVSRPSQTEILAEGDPVTVAWNPRDALLLSADEERTP